MTDVQRPTAAVIEAGGVFLPAAVCYPLWNVLRQHLAPRLREGGHLRPGVAEAVEALRAAALADVSANGPDLRTLTDISAESARGPVTTAALAGRLGVTDRHVRRLAAAEGITPLARGVWRADDAAHLERTRSADQCPRPPPYPTRST